MPPKSQKNKGEQKGAPTRSDASASKASSSKSQTGPTWVQPKSITHPEHHHTLNHLDQVAAFYSVLACSANPTAGATASSVDTAGRLESDFIRAAKTLSRKAVIRLDTGVKRSSCPRCDAVWVEGLTVKVRAKVNGPHDHVLVKSCGACGGGVRVPAPNLVMDGNSKKRFRVLEDGSEKQSKREREDEGAEKQAGETENKISQRQRRRIGSIKKQLLRETTTPSPTTAVMPKLSRRQKRQERLSRLASPPPAPTKTQPEKTTAVSSSDQPTASATTDAKQNEACPIECVLPLSRSGRAAERPHLPHFNDRIQGSHWDDGLAKLRALVASADPCLPTEPANAEDVQQDPLDRAFGFQALEYYEKAARSRGDHILVSGVGKNGALGPTIP